jgi:hypothetical protein
MFPISFRFNIIKTHQQLRDIFPMTAEEIEQAFYNGPRNSDRKRGGDKVD